MCSPHLGFSSPEALTRSYDSGWSLGLLATNALLIYTLMVFRDLSEPYSPEPLKSLGSISSHTRPVECLDGQALSADSAILYTGDTMGVIKAWILQKDTSGGRPRWVATLKDTVDHHRTRINDIRYGNGQLWTGGYLGS